MRFAGRHLAVRGVRVLIQRRLVLHVGENLTQQSYLALCSTIETSQWVMAFEQQSKLPGRLGMSHHALG